MKKKALTKVEKEILSNLTIYIPVMDAGRKKNLLEGTRGLVLLAAMTSSGNRSLK